MLNTKTCSRCGETKPVSEFHKYCRSKDGLKPDCKNCRRTYGLAYYQANRDRYSEIGKIYYKTNRDRICKQHRDYYQSNKEKTLQRQRDYRNNNRERVAAYSKDYYEANKEADHARTIKRRALKKKLIPKPLRKCPIEKDRLLKIYKLRAIISEATGVEHHVDHMWPLSDGGPHWSGNLQIITAYENLSKGVSVCEETKAVIKESLEETLRGYSCTQ